MRKALLAISAAALLAAAPAFGGDAEVRAAQSTITAQLDAFRADDDAGAYGYAAPSIKRIFPTLEQFMTMVRGAYQPVWKPKSFAFGRAEETGATVAQQVLLVGPDGKDYEALYTLELQPDGTWRITGVSLRGTAALGA